jgi:hypothetical protein
MLVSRARLLVTTLWVGSMWTTGYMVAPALFLNLSDKVLAGTIAGVLFCIEAWLSVACSVILFAILRIAKSKQDEGAKLAQWVVIGMFVCTLIGYFGLHPFMAGLRDAAGPAGVMASEAKKQFAILHGLSSGFYFVQSVLGIALVLTMRK